MYRQNALQHWSQAPSTFSHHWRDTQEEPELSSEDFHNTSHVNLSFYGQSGILLKADVVNQESTPARTEESIRWDLLSCSGNGYCNSKNNAAILMNYISEYSLEPLKDLPESS